MESCAALSPGNPGPGAYSVHQSLGLTSPAVGRQGAWKQSLGTEDAGGGTAGTLSFCRPEGRESPPPAPTSRPRHGEALCPARGGHGRRAGQ